MVVSVFLTCSQGFSNEIKKHLLSTYSVLGTSPPPRNRMGQDTSPLEELRDYSGHRCINITLKCNVNRGYAEYDRVPRDTQQMGMESWW